MNIKEIISNSDYIITFGSFLASDNIEIQEAIIEAIAKNRAEFIYMHPIDNIDLKVYYSQFIKYEVGSEEGVASLLLNIFVKNPNEKLKAYLDSLDIGYISAESNAGEEEFEEALHRMNDKSKRTLIVGRDILFHERTKNIIKLLAVLKKYSDLNVISLDERTQKLLDETSLENLSKVEELASYNGTVLYRVYEEENRDILIGSESFAKVAKVINNDDIFINYAGEKFKRKFIVDKNLYGIVALYTVNSDDTSSLSQGYRYKQVKIEKG